MLLLLLLLLGAAGTSIRNEVRVCMGVAGGTGTGRLQVTGKCVKLAAMAVAGVAAFKR
jgi:hypothetical protein